MAIEFKLPELGENIETGTVVSMLIDVGDQIQVDQAVLELETDKAVIEVPADSSGTVLEIFINEGDEIEVGQIIFTLAESDIKTISDPEVSELKEESMVPSELISVSEEPEEISAVGKGRVEPSKPIKYEKFPKSAAPAPAAPAVRRFAREIGLDINTVPGTGPGGRIAIEDVKSYSKILNQQRTVSQAVLQGIQPESLPDFSKWGAIDRQSMSKVRETTARHLSYAGVTIPQVTQFDKADITELEKIRKQYSKKTEQAGGKLTLTVILLKIIESAIKKFPQFNASIDMEKKEIIYKKYYNVGVAMDTEHGLLVPVVKDVDKKNIMQLSVELDEIAEKAHNRKLTLSELRGGNFSISNLGAIGGTGFTPIVNAPEVAILGVTRSREEPVYTKGQFEPRLMLPLSLSYDHRLIDGADAARFLRWVAEELERPFPLTLEEVKTNPKLDSMNGANK